jgi:hypothetical protein
MTAAARVIGPAALPTVEPSSSGARTYHYVGCTAIVNWSLGRMRVGTRHREWRRVREQQTGRRRCRRERDVRLLGDAEVAGVTLDRFAHIVGPCVAEQDRRR